MATYEVESGGKTYSIEGVDSPQAAYEQLQSMQAAGGSPAPAEPSAVVKAGRAINDIPRQIGLTARYALEGGANAAQLLTEPARYVTDRLFGMTGKTRPLGAEASLLADTIGLPKPETPTERVVGEGTRLGFGSMGGGAVAQGLGRLLPGLGGQVATGLAANPLQQVSGAVGAGTAGQASKEAGGGELAQGLAALGGGVVGSFAPGAVQKIGESAMDAVRRTMQPGATAQQLDAQLSALLTRQGLDYSVLPNAAKASLRSEVARALNTGDPLNEEAIGRLAVMRSAGVTPTRGMLTQDPVQITREQNLAKMGANSGDEGLQGLAQIQNQNNRALIGRLNDVGGSAELPPVAAGNLLQSRITGQKEALRSAEQAAWDAAKTSPGYRAPIQTNGLQSVTRALDAEDVLGDLPKETSSLMEAYVKGQREFTPMAYRNIMSRLARESNSADPAQAYAAGLARRTLEQAELLPIKAGAHIDSGGLPINAATAASMRAADSAGGDAVDLVNRARAATRAAYGYEDSSPLVRSVLADARSADPEKIAQSFIINGTLNDARQVVKEAGPEGVATIRAALATHIKKQALSGAADETGKVSQSALNSTLRKIGDEKLGLFFSPEEVAQLKATGRVASLMQSQPAGSAVNNSNSGTLLLGRGLDVLNHLPVLGPLIGPAAGNVGVTLGTRQAQNIGPSLVRRPPPVGPTGAPLLLPGAVLAGSLLGAPQQ